MMRMSHLAGSVFRSKPYRFAVQNGGFALIETKWSSFVNPWSKRLEFVIGLHRILQGPQNPEVFDVPKDHHQISDEVWKNAKIIKGEILQLLNKEIVRPKELDRCEVSKRCQDLAKLMDCFMSEVTKRNLQLEVPHDTDLTVSERDSVMLGEISPHHDYEDSKSSSETPPSYNQLNYNENIERFFQSKPKTTASDGSDDRHCPMGNHLEADLEGKSSYVNDTSHNQKCLSPNQNSGTSGSGSAGILSSEIINPLLESRTPSANSNFSYKPPPLTAAILLKHNEHMEKNMIKRHKEYRSTIKENKKHHSKEKMDTLLPNNDKVNLEDIDNTHNHNQGVKRAGSHSWEGVNHKVSKQKHQMCPINNNVTPDSSTNNSPPKNTTIPQQNVPVISLNGNYQQPVMNDVNLWPPFSVTVTPINNTNCNIATTAGGTGFNPAMFPIYYLPTQRTVPDYFNSSNPTRYQVHYMPGMMHNYNAIYPDPPQIMCFPVPFVPHPVHSSITPIPQDAQQSNGIHINNPMPQPRNPDSKSSPSVAVTSAQFQRPASTATSVKAEPGSALGSIASASVANKALSECSRKDLGLPSVCSPSSPLVSPPPGDGDMENYNMSVKGKNAMKAQEKDYRDSTTMDEGSSYYSSSYSSFFKTDTGSGSNDDSNAMDLKNLTSDDNSWRRNKNFPIRKREPPWLKGVSVTPELVYRYQMAVKDMEEILEADLQALNEMNQPEAANNQLNQLYLEMELSRCSKKISLEEGGLTSSSSSDEPSFSSVSRVVKRKKSYSSLVMVYEENAPLPSPDK